MSPRRTKRDRAVIALEDPVDLCVVRDLLEAEGFAVRTASDAVEARLITCLFRPTLYITSPLFCGLSAGEQRARLEDAHLAPRLVTLGDEGELRLPVSKSEWQTLLRGAR